MITDWWNLLNIELRIFYGIAVLATMFVGAQLLMSLVGFDSDTGFDVEVGDFDHGSGIGLFSTQTIAAFFLGFGWMGVASIKGGLSVFPATLIALGSGLLAMFGMFFMIRSLLRLQSRGNLDYESAIGCEGTVYVTIPGSDRDGGQIQVTFQGRLTTATARKISPGAMKPGERVRVTGVYSGTSFLVEPVFSS